MNASIALDDDLKEDSLQSPYEYRLKTLYFANNTVDFVMTKIKHKMDESKDTMPFKGVTTAYPRLLSDSEKAEKEKENLERSVRRAKQQVHFAVRSCGADHMLTLSTRDNIQDRQQFFEIFTRFVRLVRTKDIKTLKEPTGNKVHKLITRKEKRTWLYVAVPELQQRGAYHMHVACVGKQDVDLLRSCWRVALGGSPNDSGSESLGNVDMQFRKKRFSGSSEIHKTFGLVRYMTKYITKSFEENQQLGINRYSRSNDIPKPQIMKQLIWSSYANTGGSFVDALKEVYAIADFQGIKGLEPWNRSDEVFILRGVNDHS